jgi:hypothetical protein
MSPVKQFLKWLAALSVVLLPFVWIIGTISKTPEPHGAKALPRYTPDDTIPPVYCVEGYVFYDGRQILNEHGFGVTCAEPKNIKPIARPVQLISLKGPTQ